MIQFSKLLSGNQLRTQIGPISVCLFSAKQEKRCCNTAGY